MTIRDLIRRERAVPAPTASNPFAILREMNKMMDNFWTDWTAPNVFRQGMVFWPRVELSEDDKAIEVTAELPGLTEKDIEVVLSADGRALTIKGEKKFEEEKKEKNFHRSERSYGSFERTLVLPSAVDANNVETTFKDGVLALRFPKLPPDAQGHKRIEIKNVKNA